LIDRALLTATVVNEEHINNIMMGKKMPGEETSYTSADSVVEEIHKNLYPPGFLNT
jgi:hypothetical protein